MARVISGAPSVSLPWLAGPIPTNNLAVFPAGMRLQRQVSPSGFNGDVSGEFDLFLIGFQAQMKVLVVEGDGTHEHIRCLQQVGLF